MVLMKKYTMMALVLGVSFLISCTATPTAIPTEAPVERATEAPQQRPTGVSQERPTAAETSAGREETLDADVLTIYRKSGGFAGIEETLTVHQGGLVELTSRDNPEVKS